MKTNKERNKTRQNFLLTFFSKESGYQEVRVNGYWLVKQWNGGSKIWQVAIYPGDSFKKHKGFSELKDCETWAKPTKEKDRFLHSEDLDRMIEEDQEPLPWEKEKQNEN